MEKRRLVRRSHVFRFLELALVRARTVMGTMCQGSLYTGRGYVSKCMRIYMSIEQRALWCLQPPRRLRKQGGTGQGLEEERRTLRFSNSFHSLLESQGCTEGKSDIFLSVPWPRRSWSCQAADKRRDFPPRASSH